MMGFDMQMCHSLTLTALQILQAEAAAALAAVVSASTAGDHGGRTYGFCHCFPTKITVFSYFPGKIVNLFEFLSESSNIKQQKW